MLFIDVNFHDKEPQNDEGVIAEIKDYMNLYFHAICTRTETLADFEAFFSSDIQSNIAGKKVNIEIYSRTYEIKKTFSMIQRKTR